MGKFSNFLRKSSDKEKPPSPSSQNSTGPSIQNLNNQQQFVSQTTQSRGYDGPQYSRPPPPAYSGLPSGPRPGGFASEMTPPSSRTSAWESKKVFLSKDTDGPAPPSYSSEIPAPTGGSPVPSGGSPALSHNSASPMIGSGYPREKFGAQDGIGSNRYDNNASSRYGQSAPLPSQRQGGYGNLGGSEGGLFINHGGPSTQTGTTIPAQSGVLNDASMHIDQPEQMTEEERAEAEVERTKAEIINTNIATIDSADRSLGMSEQLIEQMLGVNNHLRTQGETISSTKRNLGSSVTEAEKAGQNMQALDRANAHLFNLGANKKSAIEAIETRKMTFDRQHEMDREEAMRKEHEAGRRFDEMQNRVMRQRDEALQQTQPGGLLGGNKDNNSKFVFEDDTGMQEQMENDLTGKQSRILLNMKAAKGLAIVQGEELVRQNRELQSMTEMAERGHDLVWKHRVHLETKYTRR
ncbi:hypothetical protein VTK56DRAFT_4579 [Thermocarpiscus australiensis]